MEQSIWQLAAARNIPESETARIVQIIEEENRNGAISRSPETQQFVTQFWKKLVGVQEEDAN